MIEHLQVHYLGLVHLLTALVAMLVGTAILLNRKGTRRHRWMGRLYLVLMLGLNGTALLIFELYGRFGPFHWMAIASLVTLVAGYLPTWRKAPGWKYRHAYFVVGSYVGLMAAAVAEVASRIPGWSFGISVLVSSVVVITAGVWTMLKTIPRIISGSSATAE